MKYAYTFLAALLLVGASAFPSNINFIKVNDLDRDFIDFFELIPRDELLKVIMEHAEDPKLQTEFDYILSDEFHKLIYAVEDLPEFHNYVLYVQQAGFNVIEYLKNIHHSFGMKEYVPPKDGSVEVMSNLKKGGGYNGLIDDMLAVLPKKEIQELYERKLKESPAFAKFVNAVSSPKYVDLTLALYSQKPMLTLLRDSKAHGVDFERINDLGKQFIGLA